MQECQYACANDTMCAGFYFGSQPTNAPNSDKHCGFCPSAFSLTTTQNTYAFWEKMPCPPPSSPPPPPPPHDTIVVSGAGSNLVNGVYLYAGVYNGYGAWCKDANLSTSGPNQDTNGTSPCGWNTGEHGVGCGLVRWPPSGYVWPNGNVQGPNHGWGIGCDADHRYQDPDCTSQDPLECSYEVRSGYGIAPIPTLVIAFPPTPPPNAPSPPPPTTFYISGDRSQLVFHTRLGACVAGGIGAE